MNPMLKKLLRWQSQPGPATTNNRWAQWAQLLMDRFGRLYFYQSGIPMTLRATCMLINHNPINQVNLVKSKWNFSPIIKLVINPVWHKVLGRSSISSAPNEVLRATTRMPVKVESDVPQNGDAQSHGSGSKKSVEIIRQVGIINRNLLVQQIRNITHRMTSEKSRVEEQSVGTIDRNLLVQQIQNITHRVTSAKSRVEEQSVGIRKLRLRKQPSIKLLDQNKNESRPLRDSDSYSKSPNKIGGRPARDSDSYSESPNKIGGSGLPKINLEHLTEQVIRQIDHKMIAYKERMGKLF